jgi:hypothetical protein
MITFSRAMCTFMCKILIAACAAYSSVSVVKQYPRASMLIALYTWANSYLHLRAPLMFSSRTAVYFTFALAVVNLSAVYFAESVRECIFIDAMISSVQIMHIVAVPAYSINLCTRCISAYIHQVIVALNEPTVSNTIRFVFFAKVCSLASAVTMNGLPLWTAADGAAYYPAFLQGFGAFLTLQLGFCFFQIASPSELPIAFSTELGPKDEKTFDNIMHMAYAYLIMALKDHPEMLRVIDPFPKAFRPSMMAIHKAIVGDSESEVMRGNIKMMTVLLSTGHDDVSALTALKTLTALYQKIGKLDPELAFSEKQMISYLSQFARNSQCPCLILHEQLLRTRNVTTLVEVTEHLFNSFPAHVVAVPNIEDIMDLTAMATTPHRNSSQQNNQHRSQALNQYRPQRNNQHRSQKIDIQCYRCEQSVTRETLRAHLKNCNVQVKCADCKLFEGSHCTKMCGPYHENRRIQEERIYAKERRNANSTSTDNNANSASKSRIQEAASKYRIQEVDDDDDSIFYHSASSVKPAFFNINRE